MAHTPLDDESLDAAIFCLSLMGANFSDYLREAYRTLKLDGSLHIWEALEDSDRALANGSNAGAFDPFAKRPHPDQGPDRPFFIW